MEFQQQEELKATGEVQIQLLDASGKVKETHKVKNLVVSAGKTYIAARMQGSAIPTVMGYMAIGTGTATPAVANTTLGVEAGRVALASFSSSSNQVTATATFPAGTGTGAITEAAIFNASTNGTMLCRTVFPVVTKQAGDTIAITWKVTVS